MNDEKIKEIIKEYKIIRTISTIEAVFIFLVAIFTIVGFTVFCINIPEEKPENKCLTIEN